MLSLESVLAMARPRWLRASSAPQQKASPPKEEPTAPSADVGISFINVGRESGLNSGLNSGLPSGPEAVLEPAQEVALESGLESAANPRVLLYRFLRIPPGCTGFVVSATPGKRSENYRIRKESV